jgi:DNA-binding transcriptional MocR family regulator
VNHASILVIGSLSKLGWGGLRIGWLRAPHSLLERLIRARLSDDLGSSIPSQVIAAGVLASFDQVAKVRQETLLSRATTTSEYLARELPEWGVTIPLGGLSMWIELPGPYAEPLAQVAARHGVTIATGVSASVASEADRFIRLCFDRPETQLMEGLDRLAQAWRAVS